MYQKFVAKFNNISFSIILGVCALIPFFFLPANISGLGSVKGVLLYAGVFLAFSFWLVAQFIDGNLRFPKHRALYAVLGWVALSLISAFASTNVPLSLWGRGFVVDSFATTLVLGLFIFLVATFARDQRKLVKLFLGAFSGSVFTIILQIFFYVFGGHAFIANHFSHIATSGTLVGSWVDFAYFVTFTLVLSLLMYEVLMPKGFFKILSFIALILSVIVLIFLNFKAAWIITIISSLLVFVYKFSVERALLADQLQVEADIPREAARFPLMSFISLLVGLFFFLSANSIGAGIANRAGISFSDIRPAFSTTTHIVRATLLHDPVFGAGAGRFSDMWNMYRPQQINGTLFWNTSFDGGYSLFSTILTTNGVLVALMLAILLISVLISGFKLFNHKFPDRFSRFIAVTAFIMFIAFVGLFFFTSPGIILIVFGFMYLGLLLGVSTLVGKTKMFSWPYLKDPRVSFFAILALVIATLAGFTATYFSGSRFASIVYFNRALAATSPESAMSRIDRALMLSQNDIYLRARAGLYSSQFATLASAENPNKDQVQAVFSQAEQSATAAVAWDRGNAANWLTLSQVYQLLSSTSADAYANAMQAADESLKRNPNNPVILLSKAQIALAKNDSSLATTYINQALALKQDYLDAYVLRASIKNGNGDSEGAKADLIKYTNIAPYDVQGYLVLGSLYLQLKENQAAIDAYAHAHDLAPNNPTVYVQYINVLNAVGNKSQAIDELKKFKQKYPAVQGIDEQIQRLQNAQ